MTQSSSPLPVAEEDYTSIDHGIYFNASNHEVCLEVTTLQDSTVESLENFELILESTDPAVVIGQSSHIGIIMDDDCKSVDVTLYQPQDTVKEAEIMYWSIPSSIKVSI